MSGLIVLDDEPFFYVVDSEGRVHKVRHTGFSIEMIDGEYSYARSLDWEITGVSNPYGG